MPNSDVPELEQTPVQQDDNELELDPAKDPASDPLDDIQDADELRAEAKKLRAIAQRRNKAPEAVVPPKIETPAPVAKAQESEFVKKSDLELQNQKKAIRAVTTVTEQDSDEQKKLKSDMSDNWDEVRSFYTPRRGKGSPEDVQEDIMDAYVLFNARRKPKEAKPDTAGITTHKAIGSSGDAPKGEQPKKTLDIKVGKKPEEWYGK